MARQMAFFTIEARDAEGSHQPMGGDIFIVSVRGSSKVTAKVIDNEDGTYRVEYKASTSGNYTISVTLNGVALPNSPFSLLVLTPAPDPVRCILRGEALVSTKARELATFEVEFMDALNQTARAEELDVWVSPVPKEEPVDNGSMSSAANADANLEGAPEAAFGDVAAPDEAVEATGAASQLDSPTAGEGNDDKRRQLRTDRQLRAEALARGGGRVEVGAKPLIMREEARLDSVLVTVLRPGQLVTVLEERMMDDDNIRARVAIIDDGAAANSIAKSWWSPVDPAKTVDLAMTTRELPSAEALTSPAALTNLTQRRRQRQGWVTLVKSGAELVAERPRLNAGERQKHMELWKSREASDRANKALLASGSVKHGAKELLGVGPSLAHELTKDPMGIGFAFGGIHPGTLHAGGKLVKVHTVRYTIGCAGHYKLHVGLRGQALALPGSPFDLYVSPSSAHAPSTSLPEDCLPLRGVVGDAWSCTCMLHASDRMGNECVSGGAPISVDSESSAIESHCIDNEDGSYTIQWRSKISASFKTGVRIDGVHVIGSPLTIKMNSGPPDVPKCEISGSGLKTALAGQPATVQIICKDQFSNALSAESMEGKQLQFGLTLLAPGADAKNQSATASNLASMPFAGTWVKSQTHDGEAFEIAYTAMEAGDFELFVWCDPDGEGARQWLTGSPFSVRVTGVRPSTSGSYVGRTYLNSAGQIRELQQDENVGAGDYVQFKPQLRDQFGNASSAEEGEFEAFMEAPDGTHPLELKSLRGLGAYEVAYEVQLKGTHHVQFLLNNEHIKGSPVEFQASPATAIASKSRLFPPTEAPCTHQQCEILLEAIDKYGNKLDRGGSRVDARAGGPGVSACVAEDKANGTYVISFSAAVVGECRVIVRLDNVEMQPLKIGFVAPTEGAAVVKSKPGKDAEEEPAA